MAGQREWSAHERDPWESASAGGASQASEVRYEAQRAGRSSGGEPRPSNHGVARRGGVLRDATLRRRSKQGGTGSLART